MKERLKQRLVGAVVLVSLAVVFVPLLFDMSGDTDGEMGGETAADLISGIPERPQVEFGASASGTLDAPSTPRLDTALEQELDRDPPSADTGERTVSSEVADAGAPSRSSGASGAAPVAASGSSASEAESRASVAPPDPATEKKRPEAGAASEPVAGTAAAGGWTVQIGSFLKSENAIALRKRLRARGYTAFVESGSSARGTVSRVFVGPMPDREQARASAAKLRREMALKGIVVPYRGG